MTDFVVERDNNLLNAMKMEKEYRKFQNNWTVKTAFGYKDKLKSLGFVDTIVYERAKIEDYLKNSSIPIENVDITELAEKRQTAIDECKDVLHIITGSGVFVYGGIMGDDGVIGEKQYNEKYCKKEEIFVFEVPIQSALVATEYDLALSLISKQHDLGDLLLEKLNSYFNRVGVNTVISGNDILLNGKKIVGSASWRNGEVSIYNYQISFVVDREKIDTVCIKEMVKEPIGISEISDITRTDLIKEVKSWLQ